MKIIFGTFVVSLLFLNSCTTGGVTGGSTLGATESPMWFMTADKSDIRSYYDNLSKSKLCIKWTRSSPGTKMSESIRGEIADSLERRGEDGMSCSNPSSDNNNISQEKLLKANQCALRRTEWRSMCATKKYSRVNGVSCYGTWNDYIHCN